MEKVNFLQFLQDDKGQFSATRLAFLLWAIGTLVVWAFGSLNNADGAMLEIPSQVPIEQTIKLNRGKAAIMV